MSMQTPSRLSIENAPILKTKVPGPKSMEFLDIQDTLETSSRSYTNFFKFAIDYGKGSTVVDVDGNVFIDWFGGVSVLNLGHVPSSPYIANDLRLILDFLESVQQISSLRSDPFQEFFIFYHFQNCRSSSQS